MLHSRSHVALTGLSGITTASPLGAVFFSLTAVLCTTITSLPASSHGHSDIHIQNDFFGLSR